MSRDRSRRLYRLEQQRRGAGSVHVVREADGEPQAQIAALISAGAHPDDLFVIIRSFAGTPQ